MFPIFNAMVDVHWNNAAIGNPIAVLVQDATGAVVDFAAAGDATPLTVVSRMLHSCLFGANLRR